MDFDFFDLKIEIGRAITALRAAEPHTGVFGRGCFPSLSRKIGTTLKPYLDQVSPESSPELLEEMEFLYSQMIFLSPPMSLAYMVKGQFHSALGQFNQAAECFRGAYEIERDPTRKTWPHLEKSDGSVRLMLWLGHSLLQTGHTEEGKRFIRESQRMNNNLHPAPVHPPEPS